MVQHTAKSLFYFARAPSLHPLNSDNREIFTRPPSPKTYYPKPKALSLSSAPKPYTQSPKLHEPWNCSYYRGLNYIIRIGFWGFLIITISYTPKSYSNC